MFFYFKNHFYRIFISIFIFLTGCQLQDPDKNHGIIFLENRSQKLVINQSNKNDVIKIIGNPHSTSIENDNIWIYLERTLTKGKYHKLGRHVLKTNNVLVLYFDKYGVLKTKEIYNKDDIKNVKFSSNKTDNKLSQRSFVETFLQSIKQKMYKK